MEWVRQLEEREKTLEPAINPKYCGSDARARTICVDRIFCFARYCCALDITVFTAVRLFDRCMSASTLRPPKEYKYMLVLAVACFDIAHKTVDCDFAQPSMETYYKVGYISAAEHRIPFDTFRFLFRRCEVWVLQAVGGQPRSPAAQEYIIECFADPTFNRKASLVCNAFLYDFRSMEYSAEQIAAVAARVTIGCDAPVTEELYNLCKMVNDDLAWALGTTIMNCVDRLFELGRKSQLSSYYDDLYKAWATPK